MHQLVSENDFSNGDIDTEDEMKKDDPINDSENEMHSAKIQCNIKKFISGACGCSNSSTDCVLDMLFVHGFLSLTKSLNVYGK